MAALAVIAVFGWWRYTRAPVKPLASVFPGEKWQHVKPEQVGMSWDKLRQVALSMKGAGVVVRHGYNVYEWGVPTRMRAVFSASKPFFSALLMMAVQDGKLKSVDDVVADFEPGLRALNAGKDASITWRFLANQISGYGLKEAPGAAFAYNDFAIALYYDTLLHKVYHTDAGQVFEERIAGPLHFQDLRELTPPGKFYVEGMLLISPMDLARFGLCMLHEGRWQGQQLIRQDLVQLMLHSPVPGDLPMSSGVECPMLPEQRSFGSDTRSDTAAGPGVYSFNWWLNKRDRQGRQLCPELPEDAFFALGACGNMLCVIPSLDLVTVWMRSQAEDCLEAFTRPDTNFRQATRMLRAVVVDARK